LDAYNTFKNIVLKYLNLVFKCNP